MFQDRIEERAQIIREQFGRVPGARPARCVEHREVELIGVGREIEEEVAHLLQHFRHAGVRAIDLLMTTIGFRPSVSAC